MQAVSAAYKEQMKQGVRNPSFVELKYSILSVEAHEDASVSDNGGTEFSSSDIANGDVEKKDSYITFEPNRWKLNKNLWVVPETDDYRNTGFVSNEMSGADGSFFVYPELTVTFSVPQSFYGLTLIFDDTLEEYPKEIAVNGVHFFPNGTEFVITENFYEVDELTITFINSGTPFRRARLTEILFGRSKVFTNDELLKVSFHSDVDFLSTDLSHKTLSFTIDNSDEKYNPLNPDGLLQYVEERQPVTLRYGYELNNGSVEWLPTENFVLKGNPAAKGLEATFQAEDKLSTLTGTYYKGRFDMLTLREMAEEVLADAGVTAYEIDGDFYDWDTPVTALLPVATHAQCLQIIANAARSLVYTDRGGVIRFKTAVDPIVTTSDNGHMDYSSAEDAYNNSNVPKVQYVNFLPDSWKIGRKDLLIAPDQGTHLNVGFVSDKISGADGTVGPEPAIFTLRYSMPTSWSGTTILFDPVNREYATRFEVEIGGENARTQRWESVLDSYPDAFDLSSGSTYYDIEFVNIYIHEWSHPDRHPVISQIGQGRVNDFVLGLGDALQQPSVDKQTLAKSVSVNYYNYTFETEESELYRSNVGVAGKETTLNINHSGAIAITATFTGGTIVSAEHFAYHSVIVVSGHGELVLTGYELITATTNLSRQLNSKGEDKPALENPLISDEAHAEKVLSWIADYFAKRIHLSVSYRGNPELDVYDTIYMANQFRPNFPVRIMSLDLDFNGGLSGKAKAVMI